MVVGKDANAITTLKGAAFCGVRPLIRIKCLDDMDIGFLACARPGPLTYMMPRPPKFAARMG
jgi:hypothetical protein